MNRRRQCRHLFLTVVAGLLPAVLLPGIALCDEPAETLLGEPEERQQLAPTLRPVKRSLALVAEDLQAAEGYLLRVVYLIPANRSAQPEAEAKLRRFVTVTQAFFADRMELMGYGPKTITYATEADGVTPVIDVIEAAQPDTHFQGDYLERWGRVLGEVNRWVPLWQHGEITFVVAEIQVQESDGSFRESSTFFGGASLDFSGVGMVTGETLARLSEEHLTDDRPYGGLIIPEIGPYPLVESITFPWFEGSTVSSTSSSAYGGVIHELSHGFGLWHDFRNDQNFNGNLMGNGLRGLRGALYPDRYPNDDTRLTTGSALLLNHSRFFNPERPYTDAAPPVAAIHSGPIVAPERGLCGVKFTISGSNLAGALLIRGGQVVADMPIDGTEFTGRMATYDYVPGAQEEWRILALDEHGNRSVSPGRPMTCEAGHNRAPYPFLTVSKTRVGLDEEVILDAGRSFDPDGSHSGLEVEWDLDGDGRYDTGRSTTKVYRAAYAEPGVYRVVARLTDEAGDTSVSMPIGIRVASQLLPVDIDIKPGNDKNVINPKGKGIVRVAVLSADEFDALQIDVATVRFGPDDAQATADEIVDVDGDGLADVLLRFVVAETGIACADEEAALHGETFLGQQFAGTDHIQTVGCRKLRRGR